MKPTIVLDNEVFLKVMHWVNKSNYEVSGLGTLRIEDGGILRVTGAMLLPQKNGATHTDIEAEDVNKALYELRNSEGDIRWWWHSHVSMPVFWSGTDKETIQKIGAGGWFAASVFNKKRELRSACWIQQGQINALPWQSKSDFQPLFLDELVTKVEEFSHPKAAEWDAEYEKNVTNMSRPTYPMQHYNGVLAWERNEQGMWVIKREATQTGTPTSPGASTAGREIEELMLERMRENKPPANRPEGLSKRQYKLWKRVWREHQDLINAQGHRVAGATFSPAETQKLVDPEEVDGYGFTQDERQLLAMNGWDDSDVEDALDEFSPREILEFVDQGLAYEEIRYMMGKGHSAQDIVTMAGGISGV